MEAGLGDVLAEGDVLDAARARAAELPPNNCRRRCRSAATRACGPRRLREGSGRAGQARGDGAAGRRHASPASATPSTCPSTRPWRASARRSWRLLEDPRSKALRHVFFAEREAAKIANLPAGTKPREVRRAAVLGAGTMGAGIAMCFANAGIPVRVIETDEAAMAARHGAHPRHLRGQREARQPDAAEARRAPGAGRGRGRPGRRRRGRPDRRSRVRGDGPQEAGLRHARQGREARRDHRVQHLLPRHRRDGGGDLARRATCWGCTSSRRPT